MSKENLNKKVFVALSGGVDSAVSAYLLKSQGYKVTGVYMKNWSGDNYGIQADCPWEQDQKDVEEICNFLDIPFLTFNFEKQYRNKVVSYFFNELKQGRTPNPDVMCNKEIKFSLFLDKSLKLGADMIATGHYAQVKQSLKDKTYNLYKGKDSNKDQSYFLYNLNQFQLSKTLFPIGNLLKSQVREIAKNNNLKVANKKDSQGICFIGQIDVLQFMKTNISTKGGNIIDIDSNQIVGKHIGTNFYTIGQREGLNIGGSIDPYYVVKKDNDKNIIYVGMGKKHPALFSKNVKFNNLHLINGKLVGKLSASIRYRQKPENGKIIKNNHFEFDRTQRAIASGQSIVFYKKNMCLGGAIIV